MRAPVSRRRWYQFSILTMLVLVTLVCVWLAWQAGIVRERRAWLASIPEQGGMVTALKDWQPPSASPYAPPGTLGTLAATPKPNASTPFWRQWMGDEPIANIALPADSAEADMARTKALFPEAEVVRFELEF